MSVQYLENGKALKGHDAVSIFGGKAQMGTEALISVYDGAIYQFVDEANRKAFDQAPGKYAPKYGGYCSTAISEGVLVEANPHSALVQDGELHVFYKDEEEDTQDEWNENPIELKRQAEVQWATLGEAK